MGESRDGVPPLSTLCHCLPEAELGGVRAAVPLCGPQRHHPASQMCGGSSHTVAGPSIHATTATHCPALPLCAAFPWLVTNASQWVADEWHMIGQMWGMSAARGDACATGCGKVACGSSTGWLVVAVAATCNCPPPHPPPAPRLTTATRRGTLLKRGWKPLPYYIELRVEFWLLSVSAVGITAIYPVELKYKILVDLERE